MTSIHNFTDNPKKHQTKPFHCHLSQQILAQPQDEQLSLHHDASPQTYNTATESSDSASHMQPGASTLTPQLTSITGRDSHQRESSLSSLGSVEPASPFTQNITNPRIVINDPTAESFHEMYNNDMKVKDTGTFNQLTRPMEACTVYQQHLDAATPDLAYPAALSGYTNRHRTDRALLPNSEFHHVFNRSHSNSAASPLADDLPSTPSLGDTENADRGRRAAAYGNVPKLGRTMTDVYSDELYNPNFAITSSSPTHSQSASTGNNQLFSQRLSAANSQHLHAAHSPSSTVSRGLSPFQATSPYAPPLLHDFGASYTQAQIASRNEHSQQHDSTTGTHATGETEPETPKTISPKDAMIEYAGTEGENDFSLFAEGSGDFDFESSGKTIAHEPASPSETFSPAHERLGSQNGYGQMRLERRISHQRSFSSASQDIKDMSSPPRLGSSGSSASEARIDESMGRPLRVGADSGTYTCTYHGCTLRFDTPTQLQKHKREGHRQSQNISGLRQQDTNLGSAVFNSQAGPHRCDRINPSTGKPCNTVFSRPYDLTRHEDTIHNERKHKVQCDICTVEKTFSRADALTRHYRVCHPEAELPGRHRRRVI